jgi:hypothetical protein
VDDTPQCREDNLRLLSEEGEANHGS